MGDPLGEEQQLLYPGSKRVIYIRIDVEIITQHDPVPW